jgi:hypothetical protein
MNYIDFIKERKIIDGKLYSRYFIDSDFNEVGICIGITVINAKNYGYVTDKYFCKKYNLTPTFVPFHNRTEEELAYKKINALIAQRSSGEIFTANATRTRSKKAENYNNEVTPDGINFVITKGGGLNFAVSFYNKKYKRFYTKSLYVGMPYNYKQRYQEMLEKAIKLRNESLEAYKELTAHLE